MNLNMSNYIVYKHTSPSGKVYIGITSKDPKQRWANGLGYSTQSYFFRAIVKYGWINFKHEILFEGLTEEEAKRKEIELIAQYKSTDIHFGYNIDFGGDSHIVSKEARTKISESKKGSKWSIARRIAYEQYANKKPGRPVYKYDLQGNLICKFDNVPQAAKDANVPVETLRYWICTQRTPQRLYCCYSYGEFNQRPILPKNYVTKAVLIYDLSGNFIKEFSSISEAGRFLGIDTKHASDVCKGKRNQSNGYIWRYKDEN